MSSALHWHASAGAFGAAIQGCRPEQQDSFRSVWLAGEEAWLLLVADGMGGHAAGEVASRIAADGFVATFSASRSRGASVNHALQRALDAANEQIALHQEDAPETEGMGTTLLAAHLGTQGLAWISVGDSPLWMFRNGVVHRLNEDHSLRAAAAAGEDVSPNMLLSALDGTLVPLVDLRPKPLRTRSGDLAILASDGLLTLSEAEISRKIEENAGAGPEAVVRALLKAVEDRGEPHQDNCTVIVCSTAIP
jgi:PPM family protein phosphatase